jgi:hypothetical protein
MFFCQLITLKCPRRASVWRLRKSPFRSTGRRQANGYARRRRYSKLHTGASRVAEYGNPDDPKDWEFLKEISAYHNAVPGRRLPADPDRDEPTRQPPPPATPARWQQLPAMRYEAYFYERPPAAAARREQQGARVLHRTRLQFPAPRHRVDGRTSQTARLGWAAVVRPGARSTENLKSMARCEHRSSTDGGGLSPCGTGVAGVGNNIVHKRPVINNVTVPVPQARATRNHAPNRATVIEAPFYCRPPGITFTYQSSRLVALWVSRVRIVHLVGPTGVALYPRRVRGANVPEPASPSVTKHGNGLAHVGVPRRHTRGCGHIVRYGSCQMQ